VYTERKKQGGGHEKRERWVKQTKERDKERWKETEGQTERGKEKDLERLRPTEREREREKMIERPRGNRPSQTGRPTTCLGWALPTASQ
jgi:hypothetical protein